MRLLYFGDMTVDGKGKWCTLDERLKDIEERHGKNSEVYKESYDIAVALREWGFEDTITKKDFITSMNDLDKSQSVDIPDFVDESNIQDICANESQYE